MVMSSQCFSLEAFHPMMARCAAGGVVVSTAWEGLKPGVTANSIASISLNPATAPVRMAVNNQTATAMQSCGGYCLNHPVKSQELISRRFVRKGVGRFADVPARHCTVELPYIADTATHLVCRLKMIDRVDDHDVVYRSVTECNKQGTRQLLSLNGQYRRLAS
jgi:flavin reductase (DIM6/NTAB) family NADH-FMN oxidoreductase RutF